MPQDPEHEIDELEILSPEEAEALAAREHRPATVPPTREVELQDGEADAEVLSSEELRERERRIRALRPGSGVRLKAIEHFDLQDSIETDPAFDAELVESGRPVSDIPLPSETQQFELEDDSSVNLELETDPPKESA